MTTTINISLPQEMYKDAKKIMRERRYASISELVRDSLRKIIYKEEEITENGFPRWFEERVLEAEKEPIDKGVLLETEEDIDRHYDKLHEEIEKLKNAKNN